MSLADNVLLGTNVINSPLKGKSLRVYLSHLLYELVVLVIVDKFHIHWSHPAA